MILLNHETYLENESELHSLTGKEPNLEASK